MSSAHIQYPHPAGASLPPPQSRKGKTRRMPLKLKCVLVAHDVKQPAWCERIRQPDGKPLSRAAGNWLLNRNIWPRLTKPEVIVKATEDFLRERGVPESEIETIWQEDTEDSALNARPPSSIYKRPERPKPTPSARAAGKPAMADDFHMEPEMLSQQAKQHFRIPRDPFKADVTEPKDVYLNPDIRYVREAMYQAAISGDVLAVIAEVGAGKSTLRRDLQERFIREETPIVMITPQVIDKRLMKADHIAEAIIQTLKPEMSVPNSLQRKADRAAKLLIESMDGGNKHVIFIEEGQDLTTRMLKMLKRFAEMEKGMRKLLSIIIVGQTELDRILNLRANPEAREFIHRCGKINLPPLDKYLEDYLTFKFKRVGVELADVFEKNTVDAIREALTLREPGGTRSMLYPLYINNVVTKALNLGASLGVAKVNATIIKELK